MRQLRLSQWLAVAAAAWCLMLAAAAAQETKGKDAETQPAQADQAPAESADKPVFTYDVPDGDVAELLAFIDQVKGYQPRTLEDIRQYQQQAPVALKQAADRILELEKDKSSRAYRQAVLTLLIAPEKGPGSVDAARKRSVLDELSQHVAGKAELEIADLQLAMMAGQSLEMTGQRELAAHAYGTFGELFAKSDNKGIARFGRQLQGSARRLLLLGSQMQVKGTTLDGQPLDLATLKGQVVLVDFWATWCGPCIAEMSNVRRLYELYHQRGFEVVGISVDEEREAVERFVQERQIPWPILFDGGDEEKSIASYYGIMAIPAMFLVGKDGKVLSLNARGPVLEQLLQEQLGPAAEKAKKKNDSP